MRARVEKVDVLDWNKYIAKYSVIENLQAYSILEIIQQVIANLYQLRKNYNINIQG